MSYNRTICFTEQPKGFTVDYLGPEPVPASEVESREKAARELGKREALEEARQELQRMRVEFGDRHDQVLAALQNQFSEMSSELIEEGLTSKMDHLQLQREVEALEGELAALRPPFIASAIALAHKHGIKVRPTPPAAPFHSPGRRPLRKRPDQGELTGRATRSTTRPTARRAPRFPT